MSVSKIFSTNMVEETEVKELPFGENDDQNGGDVGGAEQDGGGDVDEGETLDEDGHHHHHHYHEHKLY